MNRRQFVIAAAGLAEAAVTGEATMQPATRPGAFKLKCAPHFGTPSPPTVVPNAAPKGRLSPSPGQRPGSAGSHAVCGGRPVHPPNTGLARRKACDPWHPPCAPLA